ncbi:SUMF1/EgtB/PvdO family nonheme iron enzyme [Anabaena sp. WFMT]|uniref:SUMF1/EgtB/PvdO family nonheme iron enzyme n=1 Tax=Anabaena sp. WFMT TaxID=3449730 RepID=UPI003F272554
MNNPQQPGKYDAVLGGNSPSLEGAAVLGGIEGVKLRLKNPDAKVRIAALEQALNYGEQGLDVIIASLNDQSWDVKNAAYLILSDRTEPKVKQALISNIQGLKLQKIEVVTTNKYGQIIQRQQRLVRYFIENLGNGVILEMAQIPGGTFLMGSPESEEGRRSWESPQHEVTVPSFFMGKYQLTQKQYQAVMGNNPSDFKGENRPVENVSWNDAVTFCQRLSQKTGKNYTLPSEAQWEYACRAGTTTPFYFGESITLDLVNYRGHYPYASAPRCEHRQQTTTTDVGSFPPNAFGLYDMHGNVWEWCLDDWVDYYNNAPTDGSAVTISSDRKLLRGGSWFYSAGDCRSANRDRVSRDDRAHICGFRVVFCSRTL